MFLPQKAKWRLYTQPLPSENFKRYAVFCPLGENRHCLLDEFAYAGNVKRVVVGFFAFPNLHHPNGVWIVGTFVNDIKDATFGMFHQACSPQQYLTKLITFSDLRL